MTDKYVPWDSNFPAPRILYIGDDGALLMKANANAPDDVSIPAQMANQARERTALRKEMADYLGYDPLNPADETIRRERAKTARQLAIEGRYQEAHDVYHGLSTISHPEYKAEQERINIEMRDALDRMSELVNAVDPLNGRNVARYAAQAFTDNGDGTMTLRRPLPYSAVKMEVEKTVDIMAETRKMLR